jgi:hypothetical protein
MGVNVFFETTPKQIGVKYDEKKNEKTDFNQEYACARVGVAGRFGCSFSRRACPRPVDY